MTIASARSRITAVLICGALGLAFVALRFARSVLVATLERAGLQHGELSRLTEVALAVTRPGVLTAALLACGAAVACSEVTVRSEGTRLLVQVGALLLLAMLLSAVVAGLLMPFHIPVVRIP